MATDCSGGADLALCSVSPGKLTLFFRSHLPHYPNISVNANTVIFPGPLHWPLHSIFPGLAAPKEPIQPIQPMEHLHPHPQTCETSRVRMRHNRQDSRSDAQEYPGSGVEGRGSGERSAAPRHPPPATRHSTPDTRLPTLDPRPSTLDPRPSTLDPRPSTLDSRLSTPHTRRLDVGRLADAGLSPSLATSTNSSQL
jgi:hypothetical protein